MPYTDLPGGRLWHAENRDSLSPYPPLLLVHGAGGSHLDWPAELRRLPDATAIAPDLPGHGRSPGPGRQAISAYVGDLIALLDALQIRRAIVGGHSMGGAIAQTMAINYPERVAGLILIGTGARLHVHPDILNNVRNNPAQVYELLINWMWAAHVPEQVLRLGRKRMAANDPHTVYGDYVACHAFDVMPQLRRIAAPTLVVGGTADQMTPLQYSTDLAEQIPHAELVTVEGGGHMMMLEQPLVVAQAVAGWLERVEFKK
jgi:pimeloyl-ACP methyl ester carboxylesterase